MSADSHQLGASGHLSCYCSQSANSPEKIFSYQENDIHIHRLCSEAKERKLNIQIHPLQYQLTGNRCD